ncbi:MAG: hypothetical protein HY784_03315 [Chloroflexi bacterium]|nr:hypothetical protein [Chloroflexota bacterium]
MSTRQIALAAAFLALVFLAHAAGRFAQIGGAQIALSIAVYTLMALLMAPGLGWGPLAGIALGVGILTMLATSSPVPWANIPGHGGGFLVASWMAKALTKGDQPTGLAMQEVILSVATNVAWVLFAIFTWVGINPASGFHERAFTRLGLTFGQGFFAWFLFGFVGVVIPTWIFGLIVLPLLYRAVRPALVRQGMLGAPGA